MINHRQTMIDYRPTITLTRSKTPSGKDVTYIDASEPPVKTAKVDALRISVLASTRGYVRGMKRAMEACKAFRRRIKC